MKVMILLVTLFFHVPGRVSAQTAADTVSAEEGTDFQVYRSDGSEALLSDVLASMDAVEVVLVGEEHGNLVGHRVEEMLLAGAIDRYRGTPRWVTLSLEMFERDVQYVLDEYLSGQITELHFLESVRPWEDYGVRYRPLVELSRTEGLPVVAANAPRRYVNRVTREGPGSLDELGPLARYFLPPLPYPGPSNAYRAQWDEIMAAAMRAASEAHGDSAEVRTYAGSENALQAQALWDASMGHAIADALSVAPERFVLHFAGSFHVERGTGIAERVEDYRPGTRVLAVVMARFEGEAPAWDADAHQGLADFVILTR
ncbi:MAG: ChaN family lipoprotein [Gemmatimonadota bacterium]